MYEAKGTRANGPLPRLRQAVMTVVTYLVYSGAVALDYYSLLAQQVP